MTSEHPWIAVVDGKRPDLPGRALVFTKDEGTGWEALCAQTIDGWVWGGIAHKITHYRLAATERKPVTRRFVVTAGDATMPCLCIHGRPINTGLRVHCPECEGAPQQINAAPQEPLAKSTMDSVLVNGTDTPGEEGITPVGAAPLRTGLRSYRNRWFAPVKRDPLVLMADVYRRMK